MLYQLLAMFHNICRHCCYIRYSGSAPGVRVGTVRLLSLAIDLLLRLAEEQVLHVVPGVDLFLQAHLLHVLLPLQNHSNCAREQPQDTEQEDAIRSREETNGRGHSR